MNRKAVLFSWLRLGLQVLAWEAVLLILAWYLHQNWILMQHLRFSDALFFVGVVVCTIGSGGMLRNPFDTTAGPYGNPAFPVEVSDEERRILLVDGYIRQKSFALRMLGLGLLTILMSVVVLRINVSP